eukprot:9473029-Pyramimonas_sp.AAC.2
MATAGHLPRKTAQVCSRNVLIRTIRTEVCARTYVEKTHCKEKGNARNAMSGVGIQGCLGLGSRDVW